MLPLAMLAYAFHKDVDSDTPTLNESEQETTTLVAQTEAPLAVAT